MKPRLLLTAAAVTLLVAIACGGSAARPSQPAPPAAPPAPPAPIGISGSWTGSSVDSQGTTVVNWAIEQSGRDVTGTVTTRALDPADGSCNACHRNKSGTFTGTIAGDVLTLTLHFAAGVDGDPTPICSATMTGSASRIGSGDLSGTYSGSDSCEGLFLDGRLTMSRRQ